MNSTATNATTNPSRATLLPGSPHFIVTEEPVYQPGGAGEHLFVEIEKENLTTDQVADALAKVCGRKSRDIGYAGRKDRHAITRQWFSVHFGDATGLERLAQQLPLGRMQVHTVSRHSNKLRLGHLLGNTFALAIAHAPADLNERLAQLAHQGIRNAYGQQRFGIAGANLIVAQAWGSGDINTAIARLIDPLGHWKWGDELPSGFRHGPEGQVLGALRRNAEPAKALHAGGDQLRKFIASAAQSAIFNAVLTAREAAGLLHTFRVGDVGCTAFGAPFLLTEDALTETNKRAAPGVFDAFTSGPMPGSQRPNPDPAIETEERAWSAATNMDWSWFMPEGVFASPGERRPLIVPFRAAPTLRVDSEKTWLSFSLPAGAYATMVLEQLGINIPDDRRG